jgi:hypothetical protein
MREAQPLGRLTCALARTPERPPRQLTVTVTAQQVTFHQARWPGGSLPPVEVAAECHSDLSHYCVAYPSHHHGGTSVSRSLL